MTKELIERLRDTASKGVSVWGDLQMEAAKEIEILTAEREAYASAMDRMKAELAAIKNQEPVAWTSASWLSNPHAGHFSAKKTGCFNVPLFAAPTTSVREPVKIPQGYALVPIRTTRAMEEVFEEEGWEWANLLAAAEAITLEEYEEATSEPVREPLSDDQWQKISDITGSTLTRPMKDAIEAAIKEIGT